MKGVMTDLESWMQPWSATWSCRSGRLEVRRRSLVLARCKAHTQAASLRRAAGRRLPLPRRPAGDLTVLGTTSAHSTGCKCTVEKREASCHLGTWKRLQARGWSSGNGSGGGSRRVATAAGGKKWKPRPRIGLALYICAVNWVHFRGVLARWAGGQNSHSRP